MDKKIDFKEAFIDVVNKAMQDRVEEEPTLNEIVEHLEKDPKFKEIYPCEDLYDVVKYYYYDKLGWCGCGNPEVAILEVAKLLESFKTDVNLLKDPLSLCLAYELDRAGFTEHGSSVYGSWLTDDGRYFLWAIREAEKTGELKV